MSSSSSLEKCSSNFLTYYHNEYDDSNPANDFKLEILLDEVYVPVVSKSDLIILCFGVRLGPYFPSLKSVIGFARKGKSTISSFILSLIMDDFFK